ncbi:unnamed protein product [Oikopleura dioica]|uniref:Cilia- and flagella-associated protein 43 n=1 Tax=Oikopleura dioica TaxID=34765 RepID=E4YJ51_OIKDI|nr:unnamed protein product [Oikopleura dioica]
MSLSCFWDLEKMFVGTTNSIIAYEIRNEGEFFDEKSILELGKGVTKLAANKKSLFFGSFEGYIGMLDIQSLSKKAGFTKKGYKASSLISNDGFLVAQFETGLGMDKYVYIWQIKDDSERPFLSPFSIIVSRSSRIIN